MKIITKLIPVSLSIFCFTVSLFSQESFKLPASKIIGTELSVDYNTNNSSTTVNTKFNAFDGNLNTYFASYDRSGTWVGLDLGEKHIITKIAYAPRYDTSVGSQRLMLGVFEGANNPDFGDAVPLLMITESPPLNVLTSRNINCSKGFRYVRYIGPNDVRCNIAEIEFWGYKGEGKNSFFPQLTNVPTISIHTTNAKEITSKEIYVNGIITVIDNGIVYSDSLEIRGRGHASWSMFPKKPYKLKLKNKTNLLGLPSKDRSWVLINNYGDKTLMRNLLAFDLSRRLEMAFTTSAKPVDVILNGEYKGCYQICENIKVSSERVNIQQMNKSDIALPDLSGGYLLEVDAYAGQDSGKWFPSFRLGTPVKIKYPKTDEIATQQFNYIRNHYANLEDAIFNSNFKDPVNGYRRYLDVESFIRHFLVGEISGNTDTYWSTYMYKDRNNDVFKFGPVWDFDLGFDNDNRTFPINSRSQWVYEFGSSANGFRSVVNRILSDETFVARLRVVYSFYRDRGVISKEALLKVVDNYSSEIYQSQRLNFIRWNIMNSYVHQNPKVWGSYEGEVNNVRNYISQRIDWIDKKLNYVPSPTKTPEIILSDILVYSIEGAICFKNVATPVNVVITSIEGKVFFSKSIIEDITVPVGKGAYIVSVSDLQGNRKVVKCLLG